MDTTDKIVEKAEQHCPGLLNSGGCPYLPFYNIKHTQDVYRNTKLIAANEDLSLEETEPVLIAALFHDTANAWSFEGHEEIRAREAVSFLGQAGYLVSKTSVTHNCILSTAMPQRPRTVYERIICDPDLYQLGTKDYIRLNEHLRTEWELFLKKFYTDRKWYALNRDFLLEHNFQTDYGQTVLEPVKQRNPELFDILLVHSQLV